VAILISALALAAGLPAGAGPDRARRQRAGRAQERRQRDLERPGSRRRERHPRLPGIASGPDGHPLVSAEVVVLTNKRARRQAGLLEPDGAGHRPRGPVVPERVRVVEGRRFTPGAAEIIVASASSIASPGSRSATGSASASAISPWRPLRAGGSGFESEVWGEQQGADAVFRGDVFQSGPSDEGSRPVRAGPARAANPIRDWGGRPPRERLLPRQSEMLATVIRVGRRVHRDHHGGRRGVRGMNTMYAAVAPRRSREVAHLLALGFRRGRSWSSFVIESVFLALLGGALGCLLALPVNASSPARPTSPRSASWRSPSGSPPERCSSAWRSPPAWAWWAAFLPALKAPASRSPPRCAAAEADPLPSPLPPRPAAPAAPRGSAAFVRAPRRGTLASESAPRTRRIGGRSPRKTRKIPMATASQRSSKRSNPATTSPAGA